MIPLRNLDLLSQKISPPTHVFPLVLGATRQEILSSSDGHIRWHLPAFLHPYRPLLRIIKAPTRRMTLKIVH